MKKIVFLAVILLVSITVATAYVFAGGCYTNLTPVYAEKTAKSTGKNCVAKLDGNYDAGEAKTVKVNLNAGETYWAGANGCVRVKTMSVSVLDADGEVLATKKGSAPRICFKAPATGTYTFEVKAVALNSGYSWGTIDSCLVAKKCVGAKKTKKAAKAPAAPKVPPAAKPAAKN